MKVIIAGGGTGGHLFPAVALGEEMIRERPALDVLFVGTRNGLEAKWLPKSGYKFELFDMHGIRGHNVVERARASLEFVRSIGLALSLVRRFRPSIVVSAGGYASASMGAAAILTRTPLVLMEQNTRPGLVNRTLSRFAKKICVGFSDSAAYFSSSKVVVTGNPTRFSYQPDRSRRADSQLQILVLGGSSGAHRLNIGVVGAFKIYGKSVINLHVVHQTGEADEGLVRSAYREIGFAAEVVPFIDDVADALASRRFGYCPLWCDDCHGYCSWRACGYFRAVSLPQRSATSAQRARDRKARRRNNSARRRAACAESRART